MRHALNFQLGLHARGPGRDSYKGVDEWKTPASVSLDRSLIRAAPSHKVLANFGGVFRSSSSTDDADDFYGMSRPARRIDGFVSHSWRDARWLKFLALSYYFNVHRALAASLLAAALVFYVEDGVSATYLFPPRAVFASIDGHTYGHSIDPIIAASLAFFIMLVYGGACSRCRCENRMLFVDKCCISQTDAARRAKGIQLIPEVLMRSRSLILLYENDYFERLWCVFELAVFAAHTTVPRTPHTSPDEPTRGLAETFSATTSRMLASQRDRILKRMPSLSGNVVVEDRAIEMLPCYRALAVLATYVCFGLFQQVLIYATSSGFSFGSLMQLCVMSVSMLVPGVAQLRFEKQKREILDTLRSFQIDAVPCRVEINQ